MLKTILKRSKMNSVKNELSLSPALPESSEGNYDKTIIRIGIRYTNHVYVQLNYIIGSSHSKSIPLETWLNATLLSPNKKTLKITLAGNSTLY